MTSSERSGNSDRWSPLIAHAVGVAVALIGCGDTARQCLAYLCYTTVHISYDLSRQAKPREVDVQACHGADCADATLTPMETCYGALEPDETSACVEYTDDGLSFRVMWTFNEGVPREKTFSLRLTDRESGAVLLDETREATFVHGPLYDDCHDCWTASIDLNAG